MYSASSVFDGIMSLMGCLMCQSMIMIGDGIIIYPTLLEGQPTLSGAGSMVWVMNESR